MGAGQDVTPGSYAGALAMIGGGLDFLNAAADQIPDAALGEVLLGLEEAGSKYTAARAAVLSRFDSAGAHDSDGYQNSSSWLKGKAGMSRPAARGQVKQMRSLRGRPLLATAMAEGWLHESCASSIIGWTKPLPPAEKAVADEILLGVLRSGADLDDLHLLATAIVEKWKAQRPDPDEDPDGGFEDRSVRLDTTMDGAGRLTGDLTPQAAAALQAVLESLGKKRGKEDTRSEDQRRHDALLEACDLLLGAGMVPARAGSKTRADVHIPFSQLHEAEGAGVLEEAWLRARSGEHGWLLGEDARSAACDALIVPIVTAAPEWPVITEMIYLVMGALSEHGWHGPGRPGRDGPSADETGDAARPPLPLPPAAWQSLLFAMGKLAITFVSGPGGIASVLRTGLLPSPFNTRSVPIDIGYSDRVPEPVRRGVMARARGRCEWPGGCDRPAAASDVHHLTHKKDGGPTSVSGCAIFCEFHHLVCIHRWGWRAELRADGVIVAYGPDGEVLTGHSPPRSQGPPGSRAA
jgi:hypothetical protein